MKRSFWRQRILAWVAVFLAVPFSIASTHASGETLQAKVNNLATAPSTQNTTVTCPACNGLDDFEAYVRFATQMIGALNAKIPAKLCSDHTNQKECELDTDKNCERSAKTSLCSEKVTGLGLFSTNTLQTAQDSSSTAILARMGLGVINNIVNTAQGAGVGVILLGAITTQAISKDGPLILSILTQSRPVVNNYKQLLQLDQLLTNRMLDIASRGQYYQVLTKGNTGDIRAVTTILAQFDTNTGATSPFSPQSFISQDATYSQVIRMLREMNSEYKTFVARWRIKQFTNDPVGNAGGTIYFNPSYTQDMQTKAACTRGLLNAFNTGGTLACNVSLQLFKKNIGKASQVGLDGGKKALNEFKASLKKLKGAYDLLTQDAASTGIDEALKSRQQELLSTQQGLNAYGDKSYVCRKNGLPNGQKFSSDVWLDATCYLRPADLVSSFRDMRADITNKSGKATTKDKQNAADQAAERAPTPVINPLLAPENTSMTTAEALAYFRQQLAGTVENVRSQQTKDASDIVVSDPRDLTQKFSQLRQSILSTKKVLGSKDEPGSLIENLGVACDQQCSNVSKKCRY